MHTVNLIASAIQRQKDIAELPENPEYGICCITGEETETIARKQLFGKSFCDGDRLADPHSDRVGVDAYVALKYKPERQSSWVCNAHEFRKLDRIAVRNMVLSDFKHSQPWSGYATTSYKKHGSLRTPVNKGYQNVWLFENTIVDCTDRDRLHSWWEILNCYIRHGIGRTTMETLEINPLFIKKIGIDYWQEFQEWAVDKYRSPMYQFLCYLLPSQKELEAERKEQEQDECRDNLLF